MKETCLINYKDAVFKISTTKQKLKQKEYLQIGEIPVIDQGQEIIGGYTNDKDKVLDCTLPVIVFGDHTKNVKLINFPFAPGADGTKVLQPKKHILPKYLSYITEVLVFKIKDNGYARHYQLIEKEDFPLVSVPEQKAIVKKIEELFSSLDSGITDLEKAKRQLVTYRQAVLKKAFEGALTKEWREKQSDLPSTEEILKQIKEERQRHYETQIANWKLAIRMWEKSDKTGKRPSRISKPKEFPKVKLEEIENYDSIPNSWFWTRFGTVTYKIGDIDHKMPKTVEKGMPYVSTGNIGKDGKIDFDNAKQISRVDFDRLALKIKPEKGDIIFPRYGTIGRNILLDYSKEFLVSYSCAIIKNITKIMDERFALYYSLSPVIKKEIKRYTVETTQANIGIASIESFVYPLCSKKEQHQIVQEIESRLSVCDKVEENIKDGLQKAVALRQSILKKAFDGTLLSAEEFANCKSDKDYEPASVVLQKIKAEKK
ncbi:restriction endonuclease subunit S [Maribacter sp. TH_r10]|uniref:restriction endonuclease subunit S n=1 Tax=Maribacter sp. TH_r10 TaxID=3082086 RepID=UPI002952E9AA|nr:restriction endonuclease subunit S [Maribacter sp. TH_r10]MDV7140007.1 restriction endonuclease subunit S [Maribacter sp. TH_r10]